MNESKQRIIVDNIAFGEVFRFQRILTAVTQAMHLPRLMVALLMLVTLIVVGKCWDSWVDTPTINPQGILVPYALDSDIRKNQDLRPIAQQYRDRLDPDTVDAANLNPEEIFSAVNRGYRSARREAIENEVSAEQLALDDAKARRQLALIESYIPDGPFAAVSKQVSLGVSRLVEGTFTLRPSIIFGTFHELFIQTPAALWQQKPWFTILYGLFALIVVAIGGGALSRMSACEVAGRERLRAVDAYLYALRIWIKLVLTLMLPLIIAGCFAAILILIGAILFNIPVIDVIGGLLYGVNLAIGFVIAFVLLALAFSFIMLLPAVATENCGPADALQRAYAYLLSKPLYLLGYVIVALVGLSIGYVVVSLVAVTTLNITGAFTEALAWKNSALSITDGFSIADLQPHEVDFHDGWHNEWAAGLISFWQRLVTLLVAAYVVSFIFSSSTVIYLLMRKTVDEQDFSEIWRPGLVPGTLAPMPAPAAPLYPEPVGGDMAEGSEDEPAEESDEPQDEDDTDTDSDIEESESEDEADEDSPSESANESEEETQSSAPKKKKTNKKKPNSKKKPASSSSKKKKKK